MFNTCYVVVLLLYQTGSFRVKFVDFFFVKCKV